jgi:NAD(P)-dependent dehydrogenase (short-subunit alcohol dehydrogenase family)
MSRLAGRVVIVTGATSGIGHATALRLSSEGAAVVATGRRGDRLDALARLIEDKGGAALGLTADVTRESDMQRVVDRTVQAFGRIDVMICNAGIGYHGPVDETPVEHMRRVVDVNLLGTMFAARAALIHMRQQGSGHIIAVASIVGRRGVAGSSVYAATKAGQVAFIESLRAEFVGTPFHASVVLPVSTETEFRDAISRDFGHGVEGHGPRQSADTVSRAIVECIVSPKAEVYPYRPARWLAILNAIAPASTDRLVRRFGRKRLSRDSQGKIPQ